MAYARPGRGDTPDEPSSRDDLLDEHEQGDGGHGCDVHDAEWDQDQEQQPAARLEHHRDADQFCREPVFVGSLQQDQRCARADGDKGGDQNEGARKDRKIDDEARHEASFDRYFAAEVAPDADSLFRAHTSRTAGDSGCLRRSK